ncbi:hypothetical protein [Streptomyces sp. NPDC059092]|uniref:hypothetical protein n=1 Tax=Streptomyces sp. NPDC059092 TaxID=3346725 RepID=UPI0036B7031D
MAWSLLGVVFLVIAAALARPVPGQVADEEAFLNARPCDRDGTAERTAEGSADCMRTIHGTVLSVETVKSGKVTVFRVRLRDPVPAPADRPLDLDVHGELSERVGPGDEVEVTTWRNVRVSVRHDGLGETLPGLPDEKATMLAGFALTGVWSAVLAFFAAFGSARRARRRAAGRAFAPRVPFGVAQCVGVVAVPLIVAYGTGLVWDAWTSVAATVVLGALLAVPVTIAGLLWHRDEPRTAPDTADRPAGGA